MIDVDIPADVKKFVNDLSRGAVPMRQCSPYGYLTEDVEAIRDYGKKLKAILAKVEHGTKKK